ncbi:MarR family transcriptional regulator [Romboutsia ilealis]|uniref:MarR family transcriptional regulator n=1 Tax=Romboutsia faecis TaxID=2764597 RepID=A0ABR7JP19_9FIRM|nr:MarR family transcriptional regulator [Romboutsia faecis]MBC5996658.1 MarR family transcriptional regulator [Romboutsia faecis]MRN24184.1 MarR family transcriptional regulator [Romboutsia ilealis]
MKNSTEEVLNTLLVQLFNDILHIEEKALRSTEFTDLSITEIHTIDAIGTEGNRTMGEIAHDLRITVGTLTTAINRLIKKGYVERKRIEEDRRVVIVSLTEKGKNVFDIHSVFHKEMIDTILENFHGEDLDVLTRALGKASRFFEKKYESFQ